MIMNFLNIALARTKDMVPENTKLLFGLSDTAAFTGRASGA
jgi:hypothetical protein